jgi:hypothetical protein
VLLFVLALVALAFAALGGARVLFAPPRPRWAIPAAVGLIAAALTWRWGFGAVLLGVVTAAGFYFLPGEAPKARPASAAERDAARILLGVTANATAAEIRAAYRAKIAAAHPDQGGDKALAARLNAARDLLLKR